MTLKILNRWWAAALLAGWLAAGALAADASETGQPSWPAPKERAFWRTAVKTLWIRPGCCGACPSVTQEDLRRLSPVLSRNARATTATRALWAAYQPRLVSLLQRQDPDLYAQYKQLLRTTGAPKRGGHKR